MCGITGILGTPDQTKKKIDRMVDVITHRGPDDRGVHIDQKFAFGMRRLSIIDVNKGHQPISNEDGTVTVVFNGEIYNHRSFRPDLISMGHKFKTDSDTESLVHLYEQYGTDMLKKLRGMFGFCIHDKNKNILFIARDFFGIKPIYYRVKGEVPSKAGSKKDSVKSAPASSPSSTKSKKIVNDLGEAGDVKKKIISFGSEIKSILEDDSYIPKVNDSAVLNYLSYQYNPLEETLFEDIYRLQPGHYMIVDLSDNTFTTQPYWHYKFNHKNEWDSADEKGLSEEIKKVVEDSVEHHLLSDVPLGSFLSGGVDSGIIVSTVQAIRKKNKQETLSTFTIGFDHVSEQSEAKQVSDMAKTDHNEVIIKFEEYFKELPKIAWHFDEPVADPSAVALYFLAREASKKVKVVLSGEGADELFGGYNIYREPFDTAVISRLPNFIKKFIVKPISKIPMNVYGLNYIKRAVTALEDRYIGNAYIFKQHEVDKIWPKVLRPNLENPQKKIIGDYFESIKEESDSRKMQYIDINFWLPGDILAKADKMTMAHSLELRVPFLDTQVAKISAKVPDALKYKDGKTKYILRKAFESVLPQETADRKKLGFPTPIKQWIKDQPDEIRKIILKNSYIKNKFSTAYIQDMIESHISGKSDNARKIYILLMLALWYNIFIDKSIKIH
jgi:asparagine synthase (glutamine-hydrolysing)